MSYICVSKSTMYMEKVCLLLRVSTCQQDYDYQRNTLMSICQNRNWEIVGEFGNKVSGAKKNEEREEIQELIAYVKNNEVDRVLCTEISRLGRNTLEALKVIQVLNEHGVNLYLANYGIETLCKDGSINPVASLICTIMLEISQFERGLIRNRMKLGYDNYVQRCKDAGVKMGRPSTYRKSEESYRQEYAKELTLLRKGLSLRNVCQLTGTSVNTLRKIKAFL